MALTADKVSEDIARFWSKEPWPWSVMWGAGCSKSGGFYRDLGATRAERRRLQKEVGAFLSFSNSGAGESLKT